MRIGQKNGCVRQWARRGSRPRQPVDQRYDSAYLFGAVCPARDTGAALALPFADTSAMQRHLDEISRHVSPGAMAVVLTDNAGWHKAKALIWPTNIRPLFIHSGRLPRAQCAGEHLAVHAPDLALKSRLRWLRRDHRCRV